MMTILRRMLWLASDCGGAVAGHLAAASGGNSASAAATTPQARTNAPVRTAPAGHRVGATPGQKGATDYWLESQTTRLTARVRRCDGGGGGRGERTGTSRRS